MLKTRIIADSINTANGVRLTTVELEYPRFIHSELMTHRLFSRNAASSRAVPAKAVRKLVRQQQVMPLTWVKNRPGMQGTADVGLVGAKLCEFAWSAAREIALGAHFLLERAGLHKQYANRILEPWTTIKVVVTATEWANFFHLRNHEAAQPEIRLLAGMLKDELDQSKPRKLRAGEWHLPYADDIELVEDGLKVSASCCAQVSYRRLDESMEKAERIHDMLVRADVLHASPFEHQARAMGKNTSLKTVGVSHKDSDGSLWSGNLRGWVQQRKLMEGEAVW